MYGAWVALCYAMVSVGITLVNKVALTTFKLPHADVLMLSQMVFTVVFLKVAGHLGLIKVEDFSIRRAKTILPLTFLFIGMAGTGLVALGMNNVPMYSALRKQTTLIVMIQEGLLLNIVHPWPIRCSVMLMSFGAAIAGWNDLNGTLPAYGMAMLACVFTALYNVGIKKITQPKPEQERKPDEEDPLDCDQEQELPPPTCFDLLMYNSALALPFVFFWVVATGHLGATLHFLNISSNFSFGMGDINVTPLSQERTMGALLAVAASTVLAPILNYVIFLCTTVNSPLTTSVTGDLKNLGTDVVGLFAFNDVVITAGYLTGIAIATLGGLAYSTLKMLSQRKKSEGS